VNDPIDQVRETVTELSNVLIVLEGDPDQEERLAQARILCRQAEELAEAAEVLRRHA
jgi:hypothetical protein